MSTTTAITIPKSDEEKIKNKLFLTSYFSFLIGVVLICLGYIQGLALVILGYGLLGVLYLEK